MILLKMAAASALCRASSPAVALLLNNCSTFSECSILRSGNCTFLPVLLCRPSLDAQLFPYFLPYTNHPHSQLSSSPDPCAFSQSPHAFSLHSVLSLSTLSSSCFLPPGNAKTYNSLLFEHLRHPDKSTNSHLKRLPLTRHHLLLPLLSLQLQVSLLFNNFCL